MSYSVALAVLVSALLLSTGAKKHQGKPKGDVSTYGELALKSVQAEFLAFEAGLNNLDKKTEPGHVKTIRGPLADARTYIDIFAYAYPTNSTPTAQDVYVLLVNDLTDGHFVLGEYSDLGSVHYSEKDKERLLTKCLNWKATYSQHATTYNFSNYVQTPNKTTLYFRTKKELSGHFWGHVKGVPTENNSGIADVAILQDGQLKQVIDQYNAWRHLDKIWNEKIHKEFHNYRKDLRYLHQVGKKFKTVYQDEKKGLKAIAVADEAEHALGPINNRIEAYLFYEKKGDSAKAKKLKEEVEALWKKEKARLEKEKFVDVLEAARKDLIKH